MTDVPVYIQNIIGDKDELIVKAMRHPALAVKRKPTMEVAMKAVAREVEFTAQQYVTANLGPTIQDAYDMYTLMNGEYGDMVKGDGTDEVDANEYAAGLDDKVEAALLSWEPYLSADWLGVNTIDTRLWEENAVDKFVASAAKEVYKQLAYGKTPSQILSNAGILSADVELYLGQHMAGTLSPQPENTHMQTVSSIADTIRKQVGTFESGFDIMAVNDDIAMVAEGDDEILVGGAAERLGIDQEQIDALQTMALTMAFDDVAEQLIQVIKGGPGVENVGAAPAATNGKAKGKGKAATAPKPAPTGAPVGASDVIPKEAFALLKEHGGAKDTDLSAGLGVSRATYNNWVNGKTVCNATPEQRRLVRDQIVINTNGLLQALAILDGSSEPMAVE